MKKLLEIIRLRPVSSIHMDLADPSAISLLLADLLFEFPDEEIEGEYLVINSQNLFDVDISFESWKEGLVSRQIIEYSYKDEDEDLEGNLPNDEEAHMEGFIETSVNIKSGKLISRNIQIKRSMESNKLK